MPIERRTLLDQVELRNDNDGCLINVRLAKVLVDTDKLDVHGEPTRIGEPQWHRAILVPGGDPEELMAAVNTHLKKDHAECKDHSLLTKAAAFFHTPEVVAKYKSKQKAIADAQAILFARQIA